MSHFFEHLFHIRPFTVILNTKKPGLYYFRSIVISAFLLHGFHATAQTPDAQGIVYVTPTGAGNGSAWNNATSDLHNAIHATGVKKVFVAIGTYKVGGQSFVMKSGVEIYGGFDPAHSIDDLSDNRILPNKGMGDGSVLDGENARPVIWNNNNGVDPTAVLDGFTLTKGYGEYGGGIYNNLASPTFRNLMVRGNWGIYGGGGMYNGESTHTIVTDCIFASNSTFESGGGIYNFASPGKISNPVFTNCVVRENVASNIGGIYNVHTSAHFINCLVTQNIVEHTAYNNGVFIESTYGTVRIINTTIAGNVGRAGLLASGNVYLQNSIIWDPTSGDFTASNSLLFGKNDTSYGNVSASGLADTDIFNNPSAGDYTLKSGSPAVDAGDEGWYDGLTESAKDLAGNARLYVFDAGQIDLGPFESTHRAYTYHALAPDGNGIIYIKEAATGDKDGSSWANAGDNIRVAVRLAGVQQVWVATGVYPASKVKMRNHVALYGGFDPDHGIDDLTDNRILPDPVSGIEGTMLNGGNTRPVLSNRGNGVTSTAILDGFTLTNGGNSTGAGIQNDAASPTLRNLWIKGNTATADGGGMYNSNSSVPVMTNVTVSNNTASANGGGIYNSSSSAPVMTNVTVSKNTATADGGGLYNIGSSSPVMTNVTVSDNTASYAGGVFNRDNSSPLLHHCRITGNTATSDGGGMYNDNNASPVLTNTVITGNSAKNGAGMYNRTSSSPVLTNVQLTGNAASTNGGAIRNEGNSSPKLTNVTIAGNTGSSAIYATNGASVLANTIVYGGIAGFYAAQYSLIEGNSNTGNHNLNATGLTLVHIFLDPETGNYTLSGCGPAINAGDQTLVPLGVTTDLAGNTRVQSEAVDLGAYEAASNAADQSASLATVAQAVTITLNPDATNVFASDCSSLVASVYNGDTYTVAGSVTARVWIDLVQPTQYARRHYEISPLTGAATVSGRVTLYFTQEEFDEFNDHNAVKLPIGPTDTEGISHLLIEKRSGSSSDESGLPGSYSGGIETIPSGDLEVVWNAGRSRWEVSFEVTGFSGFFVKTQASPLPVRWISFDGRLNDQQQVQLNWEVDQSGVLEYSVERSRNARDFRAVGSVAAKGDGIASYSFTDPTPVTGTIYYRLRQTDLDGTYSYSRMISLKGLHGSILTAYPNPARDQVSIRVDSQYVGTRLSLVSLAGTTLQQLRANDEILTLNLAQYPTGIYLLYTFDGQTVRIIKK
jgi:parallel beta-helix repeat protein